MGFFKTKAYTNIYHLYPKSKLQIWDPATQTQQIIIGTRTWRRA